MSGLQTLIRLHRWRLDEKRRALAELRLLEEQLREQAARLEEEIKIEQRTARERPEAALTYGHFAVQAIARRTRIAESIAQVQQQAVQAEEEMAVAFQEVKRYELAEEDRERRRADDQRRKEAIVLDETAAVGFRRRRDSTTTE